MKKDKYPEEKKEKRLSRKKSSVGRGKWDLFGGAVFVMAKRECAEVGRHVYVRETPQGRCMSGAALCANRHAPMHAMIIA